MRINRLHLPPTSQGFALGFTIAFLAVVLLIFASIFAWVNSNYVVTQRNNQYNMSENAAEAGLERIIAQMDRDFEGGSISNNPSLYTNLVTSIVQSNWPVQYTFSQTNGTAGSANVYIGALSSTNVILNSQYAGLAGRAQNVDVYVTATPQNQLYNVPATVHESLQFASVPLFQFAIFYNVNLEIACGAQMDIWGPVFCNQSIWEGSGSLYFHSTVSAHGSNSITIKDPFSMNYSNGITANFTLAGQPIGGANQLTMPIGTNNDPNSVLAMINLPPDPYTMGQANAYTTNGQLYIANEADIYITNYVWGTNDGAQLPTGTNMMAFYQDPKNSPYLSQIPYDFFIITNGNAGYVWCTNNAPTNIITGKTNIYYAGYSWATNVAFYDWREGWSTLNPKGKRVEAVQIDVTNFSIWLGSSGNNGGSTFDVLKNSHSGNHIASIYIYDSVGLNTAQMPAVRLVHGAQLPNPGGSTRGFSLATQVPIYVQGHYNSQLNGHSVAGMCGTNTALQYTLPAALIGDSITILSIVWSDSATGKLPTADDTTVNAAMLEGIVPTNPNISGNYSGGVENYLRLLENWQNQVLTYNGSIIVLYYSQYATNYWRNPGSSGSGSSGAYYNVPIRNWAFDLNFNDPAKIPPLTPACRAMIRGNWYAHQ